jgi:hypothetical protein
VAREDSLDLQKNIDWVRGPQNDMYFKTVSNEKRIFIGKEPKLAGKCPGLITVNYGGLLEATDAEGQARISQQKMYWAYNFEPFDMGDPLTKK